MNETTVTELEHLANTYSKLLRCSGCKANFECPDVPRFCPACGAKVMNAQCLRPATIEPSEEGPQRVELVITDEDLAELSDCDDAVQEIVGLDCDVRITFRPGITPESVLEALRPEEWWTGVSVVREQVRGKTILSLHWTPETRGRQREH